jgi:hypothetical protein
LTAARRIHWRTRAVPSGAVAHAACGHATGQRLRLFTLAPPALAHTAGSTIDPSSSNRDAMSPQALLKRFYTAFSALDWHTMQSCYAPHAQFEDPLFELHGTQQIGAMWQMVCQTIRNGGQAVWRLDAQDVEAAGGERGSARCEARYRSGAAGRMVHNVVQAQFTFESGLIVTHSESYDFWRWSRQALGSTGIVMGWTPMLRNQVRRQAHGKLQRFLAHRTAAEARVM